MKKKALVVGSGFGGIASALRLRALGYEVRLIEKLDQIGGRARVFKKSGFTFDAGPTVITAPFLFDELFGLFDKKRENYVKFVKLDPWYRFFFSENNKVTILCNGAEEGKSIDPQTAQQDLEKITLLVDEASTKKEKIEATIELRKAKARLNAVA